LKGNRKVGRKMNKKIITIASLALASTMLLTACGNDKAKEAADAKAKTEQLAKDAEKTAEDNANKAISTATTAINQKNIDSAKALVAKVKDTKVKDELNAKIKALESRLGLVNAANEAVSEYSKAAMNDDLYNKAKAAVVKLTDKNDAKLKADLEAKLAASKKQADNAKAAKSASEQATASNNNSASNANGATGSNGGSSYTPPTPAGNGGSSSTPLTPTPSTPAPPSGGDSGGTTPPPATTYTGWVKSKSGKILWQQGGFRTIDEAYKAAATWLNAQDPFIADPAWSAGAY